jgi:hypothetical protein
MAKQIFYDPLQARWRRIRRFVDAAALAFSLLVIFFIYSALRSEPLPHTKEALPCSERK